MKMQLYILTSRTLTLRLHFYLGNVSGDSDFSFFRGERTLDPVLSICGPLPVPLRPNSSCKGPLGGYAHQDLSKTLKFREPLSSPKGYKLCTVFSSTPAVLHLFLCAFPSSESSPGRDFTKMSDCCAIWKTLPSGEGRPDLGQKPWLAGLLSADSTLPGKSLSR